MDSSAAPREPAEAGGPAYRVTVHEDTRRAPLVRLEVGVRGGTGPVTALRVLAVSRETGSRYTVDGELVAVRGGGGGRRQRGTATIDLRDLAARTDPADAMLDLAVELERDDGHVETHRVKQPSGSGGRPWGHAEHDGRVTQFVPHLTFRGAYRSLVVERMDHAVFEELRRWRRRAWWLPLVRPFTGVWLVGELPYRAQDNGYHLFRWLRTTTPERKAYYVIDADSPDLERLAGLGNVVLRSSREHVRVAFLATRLVGTHHAEYLLPSRDPRVVRGARGVRVFIRHGVSGTKNMVGNYGRFAAGFTTDRVHTSSDRERDVAIREFRYRPAQVRVTGLPRFDRLLEPPEEPPSGVLVIPTWREWIRNREDFEGSEYRTAWQSVLAHPRLARAVADGLRVTFILHPNMRNFAGVIGAPGVRAVTQGEVEVQTLLREHEMLVTDYSSVGFDVALLGRPVAYFQFDQERFFGAQGSHLDLEHDLPGPILRDADSVVDEVLAARQRGYTVAATYAARAQTLVRYHDRRNCERVAHSVATAGGPAVQWWRLVDRSRARALRVARRARARWRTLRS
jgi:CDP-Glycerol:Poly(glycerophosphate) glycerophosphotransferase